MTFGLANTIVLILYITAMFAIGLYFARRQKDSEEFFLAGRRMPWLPVALSMYASLTSATTYLVLPGMGYSSGTTMLIAAVVSPLVAPLLITCFYPAYRRLRITTSYEFIGAHHGKWARLTVALLFVLARLGWLGTVIYAPALVLATVTGLPLTLSIAMMGLLATAYTALGGLGAVLWTDVVQFIILAGGAIWIAISLTTGIDGGIPHIIQRALETDRIDFTNWGFSLTAMTIPMVGLHFVLQMMQDYGTDQVTVQRLMAIKHDRGVFKAIAVNAVSDLVLVSLLLFIGIGLFAYYEAGAAFVPVDLKSDAILPYYVMQALPAGISGLMITAIFAAAMSSMDSGIHSLATVVTSDILGLLCPTPRSDAGTVRLARWLVIGFGLLATATAFMVAAMGDILKSFATFMSLFSAPILVLFVLTMLWKRARFGAWLAATALTIPATLWLRTLKLGDASEGLNWSLFYPFSFTTCLLLTLVANLLMNRLAPRPHPLPSA